MIRTGKPDRATSLRYPGLGQGNFWKGVLGDWPAGPCASAGVERGHGAARERRGNAEQRLWPGIAGGGRRIWPVGPAWQRDAARQRGQTSGDAGGLHGRAARAGVRADWAGRGGETVAGLGRARREGARAGLRKGLGCLGWVSFWFSIFLGFLFFPFLTQNQV